MRIKLAILASATLTALACGPTEVKNNEAAAPRDPGVVEPTVPTGCIQGVVIDGLTGAAIALPASEGATGKGIMVRVREKLLASTAMSTIAEQNPAMKGEYSLCNIPVEESFPLYVSVDGYQPFGAVTSVSSTIAQRSGQADKDLQKPVPTRIQNIRLYPVGVQTQDLKFEVFYAGKALPGAMVQLRPTNANFLDNGDFVAPTNGQLLTNSALADEKGVAAFPAAQLVLGGMYDYTVIPAAGATNQALKGQITIGLLGGRTEQEAYVIHANLDDTAAKLAVVSESKEPNEAGEKVCRLNRPVEIVFGTMDGITTTVTGAVQAELEASVAGNDDAENTSISISADGFTVTLKPVWKKAPNLDKEPAIAVSYSGITLKPRALPDLGERIDLAAACKLEVSLAD